MLRALSGQSLEGLTKFEINKDKLVKPIADESQWIQYDKLLKKLEEGSHKLVMQSTDEEQKQFVHDAK